MTQPMIADAGATCSDAATPQPIDVAALSVGLQDGFYYAGKRLRPWMTFDERLELSGLYSWSVTTDEQRRKQYLAKWREEESVVVCWEVASGRPSSALPIRYPFALNQGVTTAPAYIWGAGGNHADIYALGHALIGDVIKRRYGRGDLSSNNYIDPMMTLTKGFEDEWLLAESVVWQLIARTNLEKAHRRLVRAQGHAVAAGLDREAIMRASCPCVPTSE